MWMNIGLLELVVYIKSWRNLEHRMFSLLITQRMYRIAQILRWREMMRIRASCPDKTISRVMKISSYLLLAVVILAP